MFTDYDGEWAVEDLQLIDSGSSEFGTEDRKVYLYANWRNKRLVILEHDHDYAAAEDSMELLFGSLQHGDVLTEWKRLTGQEV